MIKKILWNSSYLIFSQGITKVIAFFYTLFLVRQLAVEEFGLYSVALAYFSIVSAIADFGIIRYLVRELAKDNKQIGKVLGDVFFLRVGLTIILFFIFSLWLTLFDLDSSRASLTILAVLAVIPQAVAFTFDGVFMALQRLQFSAIGQFILSVSSTLIGGTLILKGYSAYGAVMGIVAAHIVYAAFMLALVSQQRIPFSLSIPNWKTIKSIMHGSLPYGILAALGLLYFRIDMVMLSYLKGSYETGIYGAAYKFLEAIIFIPSAISAALFPVFARMHEHSPEKIKTLYFKSLVVMFGLSLITLAGFLIVLPELIRILFPQYVASIEVLFILSFTIPFMFVHLPGSIVLLSTNQYLKTIILLSFLTLGFNVVFNYLYIPQYGYKAAAIVTVLSEALSFIIFFSFALKKVLIKR